jgi:hypothetical protein
MTDATPFAQEQQAILTRARIVESQRQAAEARHDFAAVRLAEQELRELEARHRALLASTAQRSQVGR